MKRALVEKTIVIALFLVVLVMFSFAEKASRKLDRIYTKDNASVSPPPQFTAEAANSFLKPADSKN